MSILLAYGTSNEAVIMSDSRGTIYDKNKKHILGFDENVQKIYKITDTFIIGAVGNVNSTHILENINLNDEKSTFSILKNNTYEEWLHFFTKRIVIFGIDKLSYSVFLVIGVDSAGKIRMDMFNNKTCIFDTVQPLNNKLYSTICFSDNVDPGFKEIFSTELEKSINKEAYCIETIQKIATYDNTVNTNIQKYRIKI